MGECPPLPSTSAPAALPRAHRPGRVHAPARHGARPQPLRWSSPPSRYRALPQGYAFQAGSYFVSSTRFPGPAGILPWGLGVPQAVLCPREGGVGLAGVFWVAAISLSGKHGPAKTSGQIIDLKLPPSAFLLSVAVSCFPRFGPAAVVNSRLGRRSSVCPRGEGAWGSPATAEAERAQPFSPLNEYKSCDLFPSLHPARTAFKKRSNCSCSV